MLTAREYADSAVPPAERAMLIGLPPCARPKMPAPAPNALTAAPRPAAKLVMAGLARFSAEAVPLAEVVTDWNAAPLWLNAAWAGEALELANLATSGPAPA